MLDRHNQYELEKAGYVASLFAQAQPLQILSSILVWIMILLEWLSVCLEVFIRYEFGSRYLSVLRLFLAFMAFRTFRFMMWMSDAFFGAFSQGFGGLLSGTKPHGGADFTILDDFFKVCMVISILHLVRIWWRERNQMVWHSMSFGLSWLGHLPWYLLNRVPWISRYIVINDWFLWRFIEPAFCYAVAKVVAQTDRPLGTWLMIATFALFVKNTLTYLRQREQVLDLIDARVESVYLQSALSGAPKQETAGWVVVEAPMGNLFESKA